MVSEHQYNEMFGNKNKFGDKLTGALGDIGSFVGGLDFTQLLNENLFKPFKIQGDTDLAEAEEVYGGRGRAIGGLLGSIAGPIGSKIGGFIGGLAGQTRAQKKMAPIILQREGKRENFVSMNERIAKQQSISSGQQSTRAYLDAKMKTLV